MTRREALAVRALAALDARRDRAERAATEAFWSLSRCTAVAIYQRRIAAIDRATERLFRRYGQRVGRQ